MTPAQQQQAYQAKCTHYRNGHLIYDKETGSVVFDGSKEKGNYPWNDNAQGINAAKRYVSKKLYAKCFTVK